MKSASSLFCVLALVATWTLGCPTPPDPSSSSSQPPGGPGPNANGGPGPNANGGPGGEAGNPPPGGEAGNVPPGGEAGTPPGGAPPGQAPQNPFTEPTGDLPSFKSLIEGDKSITVTVSLSGIPADARGQIDFLMMENDAPKVLHVEKFSAPGPIQITAPASYSGTLKISSHTYGDAPTMSEPTDITLGAQDMAVSLTLTPVDLEELKKNTPPPPPGTPPNPSPAGAPPPGGSGGTGAPPPGGSGGAGAPPPGGSGGAGAPPSPP